MENAKYDCIIDHLPLLFLFFIIFIGICVITNIIYYYYILLLFLLRFLRCLPQVAPIPPVISQSQPVQCLDLVNRHNLTGRLPHRIAITRDPSWNGAESVMEPKSLGVVRNCESATSATSQDSQDSKVANLGSRTF